MKKLILGLALILSLAITSNAQEYNTGIGIRGGFSNGLTVKHFLSSNNAIEGILATRWKGVNLTGLYEIHASAFNTTGLYWYYGFGGHLGAYDGDNKRFDDDDDHFVIGADGIVGIEYSIREIPFSISLDFKPSLDIIGDIHMFTEFALGIRYVF